MDSCWENEHFLQHQQQNYLQEGHSRTAAGHTCSSSSSSSSRGMQLQQAAEATRSMKHQQADMRSILCAARHPLESAPSFFRCPIVRDQAEQQMNEKMRQSSRSKFSPAKPTWHPVVFVFPQPPGQQRSLSSTATTKARFDRDD